jgi:hypothetical protein
MVPSRRTSSNIGRRPTHAGKHINALTTGEWCLVVLNLASFIVMVKFVFDGDAARSVIFIGVYIVATLALFWSLVRSKGKGL